MSLRATLIRQLLIALALIAAIGLGVTYLLTTRYGNEAYDRALLDSAASLSQQIAVRDGTARFHLPPAARAVLLTDQVDRIVFRVIDLTRHHVMAQNADLGSWPMPPWSFDMPSYRDANSTFGGLRIVSIERILPDGTVASVEVGETRHKRNRLTREILLSLAMLLLAMSAMSVLVVWRGTASALAPLAQIEYESAKRSANNLAPLDAQGAPREIGGLIHAMNRIMLRLGESIAHQRHFTGNAAHQLRTPIAGLRLQAQLALKFDDEQSVREALLEIESTAVRCGHIVDQLLALARVEDSEQMGRFVPVDIVELVKRVMARFIRSSLEKQIDLGFEGDPSPVQMIAQPALLEELVANLVDNALCYSPRGATVTLSVTQSDESLDLLVLDNGAGIAPDERDQVFQRFYRGDSALPGGAGLGLAIVREIADRHGGTANICDTPDGRGCAIRVSFPRP